MNLYGDVVNKFCKRWELVFVAHTFICLYGWAIKCFSSLNTFQIVLLRLMKSKDECHQFFSWFVQKNVACECFRIRTRASSCTRCCSSCTILNSTKEDSGESKFIHMFLVYKKKGTQPAWQSKSCLGSKYSSKLTLMIV